MNEFLISFDLRDDDVSLYHDVYKWVHSVGGYRFVRRHDGRCGELPGTCVLYRTTVESETAALSEFLQRASVAMRVRFRNVCVIGGAPTAMCSLTECPEWFRELPITDNPVHHVFGYAKNINPSPGLTGG